MMPRAQSARNDAYFELVSASLRYIHLYSALWRPVKKISRMLHRCSRAGVRVFYCLTDSKLANYCLEGSMSIFFETLAFL